MKKVQVLPFYEFCSKVLKLKLTPGQEVLAKVAFDDYQPGELEGEEHTLAVTLFGGVEVIPKDARRFVLMRLGRGSGKSTLIAAYAVYTAVTADISLAGPGSVPYFIIIAPDKPTAKISVGMAREMIRGQPALERLVVADTSDSLQLRRPDGRLVKIEAFAASGRGGNVRSRDIIGFLFEEAEFLTSNSEGTRDFAIDDEEIFRALKPRLMPGGKGMLISTPWPIDCLMGRMFEHNWGKPTTAVAIKAPTTFIRNEPHIKAIVEEEVLKDPENARREFFCELDGITGGEFFDTNALSTSLDELMAGEYPLKPNPDYPISVGCDLGFTRDSSAIAVVEFTGKYYRTLFLEEFRPKPNEPLKPGYVMKQFALISKRYGATGVIADGHYRLALKEQLAESGLVVYGAPEGSKGKSDVFQRTRAVLHEGLVRVPDNAIGRRLMSQAKLVTAKPSPGGLTTIRVPRKIGMGHGDLVSAWTLAVHDLAYKAISSTKILYQPGSPEWKSEFDRRLRSADQKKMDDYLKKTQKEVKSKLDASQYRRMFEDRR
jgi:hypothetical protein